jgi:hypothetical protein
VKPFSWIPLANRVARRWRHAAGPVLTAALLLPVPAFATIANFSWDASPTVSGQNPFDPAKGGSFDTSQTTSSQGVLLLTLANPAPTFTQAQSTWSIVGHFDVTGSVTALGGSWTNLNNFQNIGPLFGGNINVKVIESGPGGSNNMFGNGGTNYNFNNQAPAGVALTSTPSLDPATGVYTVTITFKINATTSYTAISSTPIRLQLQ